MIADAAGHGAPRAKGAETATTDKARGDVYLFEDVLRMHREPEMLPAIMERRISQGDAGNFERVGGVAEGGPDMAHASAGPQALQNAVLDRIIRPQ